MVERKKMISKIYHTNQILFRSGSRKGKTQAELALMVERQKDKKYQRKDYIAFLKEKIRKQRKRGK
jgi:hypothetical protein